MPADKPLRFAVVMDITFTLYQSQLRWGIERYARGSGIQPLYFNVGDLNTSNPYDQACEALFGLIGPMEFDGILLVSSGLLNNDRRRLIDRLSGLSGIPLVTIGPPVQDEDSVRIDCLAGMRELLAHMVDHHGYRDIAYVSGPRSNPEAIERLETYRAFMAERGLPHDPEHEYEGDFRQSSGIKAAEVLFGERRLKPRAVICANDFMAIGLMKALRLRGLLVPADVAVCGFDDIRISHMVSHQFTTVSQPFEEQAFQAASRLHAVVLGRDPGPAAPIPAALRVRSSCGCLEPERRWKSMKAKTSAERCDALADRLRAHAASGLTALEVGSLSQSWIKIIGQALEEKRPVYELEEMLSELHRFEACRDNPDMERLLTMFHTVLLEECGQALVVSSIYNSATLRGLHMAIELVQDAMMRGRDLADCPELYADIAAKAQAGVFRIVLFGNSPGAPPAARLLYSESDDGWAPGPGNWTPRLESGLTVNPMISGSEILGYLLISSDIDNIEVYNYLSAHMATVYQGQRLMRDIKDMNARMAKEIKAREETQRHLKEALAQVQIMSIEDELTHLRNRRGFLALAEQQIKLVRRQRSPFLILYADLDGLKSINDAYGHKDGDLAIRGAANALQTSLRDSDIVARLGGDEFAALICDADMETARIIADRIASGMNAVSGVLGRPWKLSLSAGFFASGADCELDLEAMLALADKELYSQKKLKKGVSGQ